jgi:hypothetical protein
LIKDIGSAPVNKGFGYQGPLNVALDVVNRDPTIILFFVEYLSSLAAKPMRNVNVLNKSLSIPVKPVYRMTVQWERPQDSLGDARSLENKILEASFSLPRPKVGRAA